MTILPNANVNAWLWWFLTDMPRQGEGTDNGALTDINGNIPKRAYVIGQWSKFVRPGWSRIGSSYFGPLRITAFKDPEGQFIRNSRREPECQSSTSDFLFTRIFCEHDNSMDYVCRSVAHSSGSSSGERGEF